MVDFSKYTDEELENKVVELYFADEPDNDVVSDALLEGYRRDNAVIKSLVADAIYTGTHGMQQNEDLAWTLANDAFAQGMPMGAYVLAQIYIDRNDMYLGKLLLEQVKDVLPDAYDMWTGLQELKKSGCDVEPVDYLPMNGHNLVDAMNYYTVLTWSDKAEGYKGVAKIMKRWPCFAKKSTPADWYEKGAKCAEPDPECIFRTACRYTNQKRHEEAFELYMKAYESGYDKASVQIAHALWFGIGVGRKKLFSNKRTGNPDEARKYFMEAIKKGYISAEYVYKYFYGKASELYREAEELEKNDDTEAALIKYKKAYEAGNPVAAYKIAKQYYYDRYLDGSYVSLAEDWLEDFLRNKDFDSSVVHRKMGATGGGSPYVMLGFCRSVQYYRYVMGQINSYSTECFASAARFFDKEYWSGSSVRMRVADACLKGKKNWGERNRLLNNAINNAYSLFDGKESNVTDRIYVLFGKDITDEMVFGDKVAKTKSILARVKERIEKFYYIQDYLLLGECYLAMEKTDLAVSYLEKGADGYSDAAFRCKALLMIARFWDERFSMNEQDINMYQSVMDESESLGGGGLTAYVKAEFTLAICSHYWLDEKTFNEVFELLDTNIKYAEDPHLLLCTMAKLLIKYYGSTNIKMIERANNLLQLAHWLGSIEAAMIRSKGECFGVKLR